MSRTYRNKNKLTHKSKASYLKEREQAHQKYFYSYFFERKPIDQRIKEDMDLYDRASRDGFWNEGDHNKGFRKQCAKHIRRRNRKFCDDVLKDKDWDHKPYPIRYEGKKFIWDWF